MTKFLIAGLNVTKGIFCQNGENKVYLTWFFVKSCLTETKFSHFCVHAFVRFSSRFVPVICKHHTSVFSFIRPSVCWLVDKHCLMYEIRYIYFSSRKCLVAHIYVPCLYNYPQSLYAKIELHQWWAQYASSSFAMWPMIQCQNWKIYSVESDEYLFYPHLYMYII